MDLNMDVMFLLATSLLCQVPFIRSAPLSSYLVSSFISPDPTLPFNLITSYNVTGDIYIGADRRLYQLDSNLTLKQTVVADACPATENLQSGIKLLTVAPAPDEKLITCWSCDDSCETRSLLNIVDDTVKHVLNQAVVAPTNVPSVGIVMSGATFDSQGVGTENGDLFLFTGRSFPETAVTFQPISKHRLDNLAFIQRTQAYTSLGGDDTNNFIQIESYDGYIYYFINRSGISDVIVGRLCPNSPDTFLQSYTEIQLSCAGGGTSYSVLRAAHIGPAGATLAGATGTTDDRNFLHVVVTDSSSTESALCVYSMGDIKRSFDNAVAGCIANKGDAYGNSYLVGRTCGQYAIRSPNPSSYGCTAYDGDARSYIYAYASSSAPTTATPLVTWSGSAPTSIITAMERDNTIALVGDKGGDIRKIHLVNSSSAYIYETVHLGSGSVLREMFLHEEQEEITVALGSTEEASLNQVFRLSLANCSQYQTCEECTGLGEGDPYCGWCTLEARCSKFEECPLPNESNRWLPYNTLECVSILDIQPFDSLPFDLTEQEIFLTVEQLPALQASYQYTCAFDHDDVMMYTAPTSTNGMVISCVTPPASYVPLIPDQDDHVATKLSVVSTETGVAFVSSDFFFFDCSKLRSCFSCISSRWACDWCVYDNQCTSDSSSCQAGETIVTKDQGLESCPQILGVTTDTLIPVNIPLGFSLLAKNLPTTELQVQGYECILQVEGEDQITTSAFFNQTFVVCDDQMYTFREEVLSTNVSVTVRWNGQNAIDTGPTTEVTLYKCSVNGGSCSRCLSPDATPSDLQCLWCGDDCNVMESGVCQTSETTLNQNMSNMCSPPTITNFYPTSGPAEGNTRIEITGTDLGVRFDDIIRITVAGRPCNLTAMDQFYQPGSSVSCVTASASAGTSGTVEIVIMAEEQRTGQSDTEFSYVNPQITGFSPQEGPVAGGTRVTIFGEHLDTGREQRAWVGDYECRDIETNGNVSCVTSRVGSQSSLILTMIFEGVAVRLSEDLFTFLANPEIDAMENVDTISSGGLAIEVTGQRFELIQVPMIVSTSYSSGISNNETCKVVDDTRLACPTPGDPDKSTSRKRRSTDTQSVAILSFDMDGFPIDGGNITYYPDPFYFNLSDPNNIAVIDATRQLFLNGTDLDLVSSVGDVMVYVGSDEICDVLLLNPTSLLCKLPQTQPVADADVTVGQGTRRLPQIMVEHGNLLFYPGYVEYEATTDNIGIIAGSIAAVAVFLIIVMVVIGVMINRRGQQSIEMQAEELELVEKKIQERVEAAFHDLQLDMSEVEEQVRDLGIPFVSTRDYTRNMMFSGLDILPATADPELMNEDLERAMVMFSRQLNNPDFLISYIHQLEDKRKSQRRDRVNIASLITIVLVSEGKFDYLTEVLQRLLDEQICDGAETGRLRALFRRTETIVEKLLSNWMSLCMHRFLKKHVARSLYLLYQSIKVQVEKGPIDIITGQSYFSLNFDSLLDEHVEYTELTLSVLGNSKQHEYYVKVLDVDCITQVKQKILDAAYRKKHFVKQNRAHEMDLIWYHVGGEQRIMRDQDEFNSPKNRAEFVPINTVKTMGISDNDRVALVEKVRNFNERAGSFKPLTPGVKLFHIYGEEGPSDIRERDYTKIQSNVEEGGHQFWHLVPEDQMHNAEETKTKLDKEFSAPHLLVTKKTIEPFLKEFLNSVFGKSDATPVSIKNLFDFFDKMADRYCKNNATEYAEAWKSNSLPEHFWMTTLTHPSYVFDMRQSRSADQSVSVLANMLDNACKKVKQEKKQESSLNRVLFVKDLPGYIRTISTYYEDISSRKPPTKSELREECQNIGVEFSGLFSRVGTLKELYDFTCQDTADLLDSITELM